MEKPNYIVWVPAIILLAVVIYTLKTVFRQEGDSHSRGSGCLGGLIAVLLLALYYYLFGDQMMQIFNK